METGWATGAFLKSKYLAGRFDSGAGAKSVFSELEEMDAATRLIIVVVKNRNHLAEKLARSTAEDFETVSAILDPKKIAMLIVAPDDYPTYVY